MPVLIYIIQLEPLGVSLALLAADLVLNMLAVGFKPVGRAVAVFGSSERGTTRSHPSNTSS